MKVTLTRIGGYDPSLPTDDPSNRDPSLEPCVVSLESTDSRHRWRCSCGAAGTWKPREFQAKQGAAKHAPRSTT